MRPWHGLAYRFVGVVAILVALGTLAVAFVPRAVAFYDASRTDSIVIRQAEAPDATAAPRPPASISIAAVGDLMFARDIVDLTGSEGPGYPFARVMPLLGGTDLLLGNFEGTFTERGVALDKTYTFRAPPDRVASLAGAHFSAVSLGNNHVGDFGRESVEDTLAALQGANIGAAGAGLDAAAAHRPLVLHGPQGSIALLSYSGVGDSAFADGARAGVARAAIEGMRADVAAARPLADFVVVALHAGIEYSREPTAFQRDFDRAAIDAGARLVIGHHPHVLQGWERYHDGLILYSLGNFVFDLEWADFDAMGPPPFQTGVAVVTLRADAAPQLDFRPVYIDADEDRPRPATPSEAGPILDAFRRLDSGG